MLEALRWDWEPTTCRLHDFEIDEVVRQLQALQSTLFFAGDSVQMGMADDLKCKISSAADAGSLVKAGRVDYLFLDPDKAGNYVVTVDNARKAWRQWLKDMLGGKKRNDADVLVLNAGAHWIRPPGQTREQFRTLAQALKLEFSGLVVFRTTVMGHSGCWGFTAPLGTEAFSRDEGQNWNWMTFPESNKAMVESLKEELGERFVVLNVTMFEMRGDGHPNGGDCLHYCKPGPDGLWNKFFLHVLHEKLLKQHEAPKEKVSRQSWEQLESEELFATNTQRVSDERMRRLVRREPAAKLEDKRLSFRSIGTEHQ